MIKHVVMWKINDQSKRQIAIDALLSMKGKIDGLLDIEAGSDFLASERSFDIALVCTFKDRAAMDFYNTHPLHEPAKKIIGEIKTAGAAVDFEY